MIAVLVLQIVLSQPNKDHDQAESNEPAAVAPADSSDIELTVPLTLPELDWQDGVDKTIDDVHALTDQIENELDADWPIESESDVMFESTILD